MRKIIFDIETKNTFQEVGSNDATDLDMSLLVAYDSATDTYHTFMEDNLTELWQLIEQSDVLIGYNSDHFDIPLLNKYYPGDLSHMKSLDLLVEIKKSIGKRVRLDAVAEATLGSNKTGSGLDAIKWWRQGEIEKIAKYCEADVKITKEVYDYAVANKKLKYKDYEGIHEFPIDTSAWEEREEKGLTMTLPF